MPNGRGIGEERAPYGRRNVVETRPPDARRDKRGHFESWGGKTATGYDGPTYYGRPAIKPAHYRWLIISYLFLGGLAGAAQIIAIVADLFGDSRHRSIVRTGRYLALLGSLACPGLLIADLHTRQRWPNMLRIFRRTSPMSIGSWTLFAFGTLSGLTATAQLLTDLTGAAVFRVWATIAGIAAAIAGQMMSIYTGSLLAATSVPFWAAGYRLLPPLFGASAMSTATAAIALVEQKNLTNARPLERLGLIAGSVELVFALMMNKYWHRHNLAAPLDRPPAGAMFRLGAIGLGTVVPLAIHLVSLVTGLHSRTATIAASMAALSGGYWLRAAMIIGGNDSAQRPEDYFLYTQQPSVEERQP